MARLQTAARPDGCPPLGRRQVLQTPLLGAAQAQEAAVRQAAAALAQGAQARAAHRPRAAAAAAVLTQSELAAPAPAGVLEVAPAHLLPLLLLQALPPPA